MRAGSGTKGEPPAAAGASSGGVVVTAAEKRDDRARPILDDERTPGAQALVDAARRLLARGGYDALRLEAIAAESGQNKAMIRYWFGDKAGLPT